MARPINKQRGSRPVSRKAKIWGGACGLLLASAVVILSMASYHGGDASDFAAADFSSMSAAAALTASEQRLANNDPDGAVVLARQVLATSPISSEALRTAAIAEQARGNSRYAYALLSQAAALGWRDLPSQIWLAQAQLESGHNEEAARRLDAALRASPNSAPLFDTVDSLIMGSPAIPAFVRRMTLDPDWRTPYLSYVTDKNFRSRIAMARLLSDLHSPPGRKEMLLIVHPLIGAGKVGEARALWFQTQGGTPGSLNDPRFRAALASGAGPFDWSFPQVLGATAEQDAEGAGGLQVKTDGQASGVLARQLVVLSPGTHHIAFQGTTPAMHPVFHWQMLCLPGRKTLVQQVDVPNRAYSLVVPSAECPYQTLELSVTSDPGGAGRQARFSKVDLE